MPKLLLLSLFFLFFISEHLGANVVGSDLQNFNASPSGVDYVTVHSAETLEPQYINLGLMANYSINSLPVFSDEDKAQNNLNVNDTLLTTEVLASYGLTSNLEIGLGLGVLLKQTVNHNDASKGFYRGQGVTNSRFHAKYNFWHKDTQGLAFISSVNFNHIKKNPYLGDKNSPIYQLELAYEKRWLGMDNALNFGYRWRNPGQQLVGSMIEPTRSQLLFSLGSNYLITAIDTKLIGEIFGSRPAGKSATGSSSRQASSLEGLFGIKYDQSSNLALHFGAGTELLHGVASPDLRLYAGINYTFAPPEKPFTSVQKSPATSEMKPQYTSKQEDKFILYNINFDSGSADLTRPEAIKSLEIFVKYATKLGAFSKLEISGHTDSIGSAVFNQKLSLERAQKIKAYLVEKHGFSEIKLFAIGLGEIQPIADNGNLQGRLKNRRVEIRIIKSEN